MIILLALITPAFGHPAQTFLRSHVDRSLLHSPYPVSRPTIASPLEFPASPYARRPPPLRYSPAEIPRSPYSTKQARIQATFEEHKSMPFPTAKIEEAKAATARADVARGIFQQGFLGKYFGPHAPVMTLLQSDVPAGSLKAVSTAPVILFCLFACGSGVILTMLLFRRKAPFVGDDPLLHA